MRYPDKETRIFKGHIYITNLKSNRVLSLSLLVNVEYTINWFKCNDTEV